MPNSLLLFGRWFIWSALNFFGGRGEDEVIMPIDRYKFSASVFHAIESTLDHKPCNMLHSCSLTILIDCMWITLLPHRTSLSVPCTCMLRSISTLIYQKSPMFYDFITRSIHNQF